MSWCEIAKNEIAKITCTYFGDKSQKFAPTEKKLYGIFSLSLALDGIMKIYVYIYFEGGGGGGRYSRPRGRGRGGPNPRSRLIDTDGDFSMGDEQGPSTRPR